jgi:hypothetical protein
MRRIVPALAAMSALATFPAQAAADPADRACLGQFHSASAQALGGVGEFARSLTHDPALHPLGIVVVSYEATTCDILFD